MDTRLESVESQVDGLRRRALQAWLGHDPAQAREQRDEWRPRLVLRNAAPRARGGVAEVELLSFLADVPVGPGSAAAPPPARRPAPPRLDRCDGSCCRCSTAPPCTTAPSHRGTIPTTISSSAPAPSRGFPRCRRSARASFRCSPSAAGPRERATGPDVPVRAGRSWLDNGLLRAEVIDGRVRLTAGDRVIPDLLALESVGDGGDSYTHSPLGEPTVVGAAASVLVHARGPLRGALTLRYSVPVPAWRTRDRVAPRTFDCPIYVTLSLDAAEPLLRLRVEGSNRSRDHRLRLRVRTDADDHAVWADAAFGAVRRGPLHVPAADQLAETPPPTAPLHRYVTLAGARRGATLFADGLAEYQATDEASVAVTLLRCVGELSRGDLPERPGHAGWPAPIPLAQSLGPFAAAFALLLHGPRDDAVAAQVEQVADDVLLPLTGRDLALGAPPAARRWRARVWTVTGSR